MTNLEAARAVIERVRGGGVRDFCVCGGSRNAPLIKVLTDGRWPLAEAENSSANGERPTANVFSFVPAAVEAYYSGAPLILITADRPSRFRGTGAPQAIEQVGLFGVYAATDFDRWNRRSPLHINVEFDEPLIE